MDVAEAIKTRRSIRAFKPDPVPPDIIRDIIGLARYAPSWANTQPWEFAVVTGEKLKAIEDDFIARGIRNPNTDITYPFEFPEPYQTCIRNMLPKGITKMTQEYLRLRTMRNFRHYGATTCIYLLINKNLVHQPRGTNAWALYDCGSVVQNIMLLAVSKGLGTVAQGHSAVYPDIIKRHINIPDTKLIVLGIAIGYPDTSNPECLSDTSRKSLDSTATFYDDFGTFCIWLAKVKKNAVLSEKP